MGGLLHHVGLEFGHPNRCLQGLELGVRELIVQGLVFGRGGRELLLLNNSKRLFGTLEFNCGHSTDYPVRSNLLGVVSKFIPF